MVVSSVGLLTVVNPILWVILSIWIIAVIHDMQIGYSMVELLTTRDAIHDRWSWPMLFLGEYENRNWAQISVVLFSLSCILFAANFLFILINCIYGIRPDQKSLFWAALLSPLYWILMSIAAWKAVWQLITRPHYWEKTVHGLDGSEVVDESIIAQVGIEAEVIKDDGEEGGENSGLSDSDIIEAQPE
ncbi:MAG: hypothetical protein HRU15_09370 [Planctomycetes bacterium]|nr:hypothetical protein [Planctomycetota bacterium]